MRTPDAVGGLLPSPVPEPHAFRRPTPARVLGAVGRRLVPQLVEATLVPSLLFVAVSWAHGLPAAFVAALGWSYLALLRRLATGRAVPALLVLSTIGLTVRTAVALGSGSTFVYFVQPVLGTTALSLVFLTSALIGRPLIARFAVDFCSLSPEVTGRPGVQQLYSRLTYLWALVNLAAAATTFALLQALPVGAFVALRPPAMWTITTAGVVLTVRAAVRAAHREGLLACIGPGGSLTAVAA